jgi:protoheme IX farnesyltransferase
VVQLIVFCALIGMVLASRACQLARAAAAADRLLGIWLVAGAAAAFNCIVEKASTPR